MAAEDELWPAHMSVKMVVFDFDKTITAKHTRGAIWMPDHLETANLQKNFADFAFFKQLMAVLKAHNCFICVATYADTEEGALSSGGGLVRAYLDAALEGNSQTFIPDDHIEAWNPENRRMDPKKVGKNKHIEALVKRIAPGIRKKEVVLFDDTEGSVLEARARGYLGQYVPAAEVNEDTQEVKGGLTAAIWREFVESERTRPRDKGCLLM
eukprot:m.234037 g.234037  ORF g.234037 m.234037 type:complete len:211 (+) comp19392_c0_seq1:99-731(+)